MPDPESATGASDASVPELPFVDDLLKVARDDLDAARGLLQRLLSIGDALLASTLTVAGLFLGLAFSNHSKAAAFVAVPIVLVLAYLDAANWVHFRGVTSRIRSLEGLFDAYIIVLRERGTVRPDALSALRGQIDEYQFGIEGTLETPTRSELWEQNHARPRFWIYLVMAAVLAACGFFFVQSGASTSATSTAHSGCRHQQNLSGCPTAGRRNR